MRPRPHPGVMLVGQQATQQCLDRAQSYEIGLLAADLDGAQLPPTGSPEYVLALGASASRLRAFWKFHVVGLDHARKHHPPRDPQL